MDANERVMNVVYGSTDADEQMNTTSQHRQMYQMKVHICGSWKEA